MRAVAWRETASTMLVNGSSATMWLVWLRNEPTAAEVEKSRSRDPNANGEENNDDLCESRPGTSPPRYISVTSGDVHTGFLLRFSFESAPDVRGARRYKASLSIRGWIRSKTVGY